MGLGILAGSLAVGGVLGFFVKELGEAGRMKLLVRLLVGGSGGVGGVVGFVLEGLGTPVANQFVGGVGVGLALGVVAGHFYEVEEG